MDKLTQKKQWAEKYIEEYKNSELFNPWNFLTGEKTKKDILFESCITLQLEIEKALEKFEKSQEECLQFGGAANDNIQVIPPGKRL